MSSRFQVRKGNTAQNDVFTGSLGELSYDTDKKQLRVHDGETIGGLPLAKTDEATPNATELVAGKAKIATTEIAQGGVDDHDFITAKKLREAVNCPSTLKPFSCVAWLSVDETTAPPTIKGSGNIESVELLSQGKLRVIYSQPMPDLNYTPLISIFSEGSALAGGTPAYFVITEMTTASLIIATGQRDAGVSFGTNMKGVFLGVFR